MNKTIKIIIVTVVILIGIFVLFLLGGSKGENVFSGNSSVQEINKIAEKKTNGIYEIYNTDITSNGGITKFTASIKNVSGSAVEKQRLEIVLVDKAGKELGSIMVTVPSLDIGAKTEVMAEDLTEYESIYDFRIK